LRNVLIYTSIFLAFKFTGTNVGISLFVLSMPQILYDKLSPETFFIERAMISFDFISIDVRSILLSPGKSLPSRLAVIVKLFEFTYVLPSYISKVYSQVLSILTTREDNALGKK
jgi:hypothetical protein